MIWNLGLLAFEEENMDAVSISRRTSIPAGSIHGGSNFGTPQIGGFYNFVESSACLFVLEMNTRPLKVEIHQRTVSTMQCFHRKSISALYGAVER